MLQPGHSAPHSQAPCVQAAARTVILSQNSALLGCHITTMPAHSPSDTASVRRLLRPTAGSNRCAEPPSPVPWMIPLRACAPCSHGMACLCPLHSRLDATECCCCRVPGPVRAEPGRQPTADWSSAQRNSSQGKAPPSVVGEAGPAPTPALPACAAWCPELPDMPRLVSLQVVELPLGGIGYACAPSSEGLSPACRTAAAVPSRTGSMLPGESTAPISSLTLLIQHHWHVAHQMPCTLQGPAAGRLHRPAPAAAERDWHSAAPDSAQLGWCAAPWGSGSCTGCAASAWLSL